MIVFTLKISVKFINYFSFHTLNKINIEQTFTINLKFWGRFYCRAFNFNDISDAASLFRLTSRKGVASSK